MVQDVSLHRNPSQLTLHLVFIPEVSRVHEDMGGHQVEVGSNGEDVHVVDQRNAGHVLDIGAKGVEVNVFGYATQQDVRPNEAPAAMS